MIIRDIERLLEKVIESETPRAEQQDDLLTGFDYEESMINDKRQKTKTNKTKID